MPSVRRDRPGLGATGRDKLGLRSVPVTYQRDRRDDLSPDPHAADRLVPGRVGADHPRERGIGPGRATHPGARLVPDGVDDAAPVSARDGDARPGSAVGHHRGRRHVRRGTEQAWYGRAFGPSAQDAGAGNGRASRPRDRPLSCRRAQSCRQVIAARGAAGQRRGRQHGPQRRTTRVTSGDGRLRP